MPPPEKPLSEREIEQLRIGLKDHLVEILTMFEKSINYRFDTMEKANSLAYTLMNNRMDTLINELKSTTDILRSLVTKNEFEMRREKVDADIASVAETGAKAVERLQTEVTELRDFKTAMNAKVDQKAMTLAYVFIAINILISVAGLILAWSDRITGK